MPVVRVPTLAQMPDAPFPPAHTARQDPDGLLALGGDLSAPRLLNAYRHGIFPWYAQGQPILWWSPDPRMVFATDQIHLSRRFRRQLRQSTWQVRADTAFDAVIDACAHIPRHGQDGTWITAEMIDAYSHLHTLGHAHSVEVFADDVLAGGIYGVAIGQMFFAESMFSAVSGGSKVALAALGWHLQQWGWPWIDAQLENPHLLRLGVVAWPRDRFITAVARQTGLNGHIGSWQHAFGQMAAARLAN